jgi:hypothetical protein
MSLPSDYPDEMQRFPLDLDTADRLLGGSIAPADAPPGYSRVATLVVGLDSRGEEIIPPQGLVSILAATVRSSPAEKRPAQRRTILPRIKLAAALTFAALVGTTGLAFAGSLPGAAQDIASAMLAKAGVTVPGPNSNAGDHPNTRGSSENNTTVAPTSAGKGSEISGLATSDLTGLEKGVAVSTAASDGKSRAGQDHAAPPIETPSTGGAGTADTASGGASSPGTTEADQASDGHSSAGAENAADGQSHRP